MAGGENRRRIKSFLKQIIGNKKTTDPKSETLDNEIKIENVKDSAPNTLKKRDLLSKSVDKVETKKEIKTEAEKKTKIHENQDPKAKETSTQEDKKDVQKTISEDKVAKHWLKAKKGVLKKAKELGENASLADLHEYSEKRFFIGHQKFSQLMEELVDEELIHYNWDTQEANITDKGIAFMTA